MHLRRRGRSDVGDEPAGAIEQRERLLGTAGEPRVVRGGHEPAPAGLVVARQLGRALERAAGGREPAPAPRPPRRLLELVGHLVVLAERGRRAVPRAAIRVLLAVEHVRERPVDGLPLRERGIAVQRRADERMAQRRRCPSKARTRPASLGRIERVRLDAERRGRLEDRRQAAGVVGRDEQEQTLRRRRQAARALQIDALDLGALRERIRQRRATGKLVLAQEARELDQRERNPAGALDQAVAHLGRQRRRHVLGEQRPGRLGAEAREPELRQPACPRSAASHRRAPRRASRRPPPRAAAPRT